MEPPAKKKKPNHVISEGIKRPHKAIQKQPRKSSVKQYIRMFALSFGTLRLNCTDPAERRCRAENVGLRSDGSASQNRIFVLNEAKIRSYLKSNKVHLKSFERLRVIQVELYSLFIRVGLSFPFREVNLSIDTYKPLSARLSKTCLLSKNKTFRTNS